MKGKEGKILVLGGTGAMGVYLVPELCDMGYQVDVISLDDVKSDRENLTYTVGNCMDNDYLAKVLERGYDAIVDFLIYSGHRFDPRLDLLLSNTKHYIYLSSYRVYADEQVPITESAPRLWDVSPDKDLLASDDYCIYKAKGEDSLHASKYNNYTIIRPAPTFSKRRFQLVTLEGNVLIRRALEGKPVLLPIEAKNVQATMSWGGDVGRMIARLVLNEKAMGNTYTTSTAEHHTWGEIAEYYVDLVGLKPVWVDEETYLHVMDPTGGKPARWQLEYDRLFIRIIDNSAILGVTGMKQEELMPLYDGLKLELSRLPEHVDWNTGNPAVYDHMDEYFASKR